MIKKTLSLLLAVCMICSTMSSVAFAEQDLTDSGEPAAVLHDIVEPNDEPTDKPDESPVLSREERSYPELLDYLRACEKYIRAEYYALLDGATEKQIELYEELDESFSDMMQGPRRDVEEYEELDEEQRKDEEIVALYADGIAIVEAVDKLLYDKEFECVCELFCGEETINEACTACLLNEDISEVCKGEVSAECSCETKCDEENINSECAVCSAEDADLSSCAGEDAPATVVISEWSWADEWEIIEPESGVAMLVQIGSFDEVAEVLPVAILYGEDEEATIVNWDSADFAEETGSYTFTAELADGFELDANAPALTLTVEMGQAMLLPNTSHADHCVCGAEHKVVGDHNEKDMPKEWIEISQASDFANNKGNGYYYLTENIELNFTWQFTKARDIVLCLNGHDITFTGNSGSFISGSNVNFTLTDCQSEAGEIKGFKTASNGGAIYVGKEFTMYNGIITGNTAKYGAGVYVDQVAGNNAVFRMYGGQITGNTASTMGGGVYVKGLFEVADAPVVNNNYNSNTATTYPSSMYKYTKNIYLSAGAVKIGEGGLSDGTQLDITPRFPVVSGTSPDAVATIATNSTSDYSEYFSYTSSHEYSKHYDAESKEVQLKYIAPPAPTVEVTFNMNGHGDQVPAQTIEKGTCATKPENPTANGYRFLGWEDDYGTWDFGWAIYSDTVLNAKWEASTYILDFEYAENGTFTVTVDDEPVASGASVDAGKTVTVTTDPADGYEVATVQYNGNDATKQSDNSYTFEMPAGNTALAVTFKPIAYPVWVGGEQFNIQNLTINGSSGTADLTVGGTVDAPTYTLTLDGFEYSGEGYKYQEADGETPARYAAIYSEGIDLNIVLVGDQNSINCTGNEKSEGIFCAADNGVGGKLSISGNNAENDKLTVVSTVNDITSSKKLTVKNAGITVDTPDAVTSIYIEDDFEIIDSVITADCLVASLGDMTVTGSKITANNLLSSDEMDIDSSIVNVNSAVSDSSAMLALGDLTIKDSNVKAINSNNSGIVTVGAMSVTDSTVDVTANGDEVCGIECGDLTVKNGFVDVYSEGCAFDLSGSINLNNEHKVYGGRTKPTLEEVNDASSPNAYMDYCVRIAPDSIVYHPVWIGEQQFTGEQMTIEGTTGTATLAVGNNNGTPAYTLTLDNFSCEGEGVMYSKSLEHQDRSAIFANADLTVLLVGENSLSCTGDYYDAFYSGINTFGSLTVGGTGSLQINSKTYGMACYGDAVEIVIENCRVKIDSGVGLYDDCITINNATVEATTENGSIMSSTYEDSGWVFYGVVPTLKFNGGYTIVAGDDAESAADADTSLATTYEKNYVKIDPIIVAANLYNLDGSSVNVTVTLENDSYVYTLPENLPAGIYQLVVTTTVGGEVTTISMALEVTEETSNEVSVPSDTTIANKNSVVDNKNAGDYTAIVGGLDEIANKSLETDPVTISLVVTEIEENDSASQDVKDEIEAIKGLDSAKTFEFVDFTLNKKVGSNTDTDIGDSNTELIKITVNFTTEGRKNITAYRYHDTSPEALSPVADNNTTDEGFYVGNGYVTIFAMKFSTYAIGYEEIQSGNGGGGNSIGSSDDDDDSISIYRNCEEEFWKQVEQKIKEAKSGYKVIARVGGYDMMPAYVMDALRERGDIMLEIHRNSGEIIVIPAGKALDEPNRTYYPLSYLTGYDFGGTDLTNVNPGTGGILEITAPAVSTTTTPSEDQPKVIDANNNLTKTQEPVQRDVEKTASIAIEPAANSTKPQSTTDRLAGIVLMLAVAAVSVGYVCYRKRKSNNA